MTCVTFFRGSLTAGSWLALIIARLSLSAPFLPSLSYTEPGRSRVCQACSYTSIPLHRYLSPWNAFCGQFTCLILEASIQILLLQSYSYFLKIEVGVITMFPLRCVHSSRIQLSLTLFSVCLLIGLYSIILDIEQLEIGDCLLLLLCSGIWYSSKCQISVVEWN